MKKKAKGKKPKQLSPEEIFNAGEKEVAKAMKEVDKKMRESGF